MSHDTDGWVFGGTRTLDVLLAVLLPASVLYPGPGTDLPAGLLLTVLLGVAGVLALSRVLRRNTRRFTRWWLGFGALGLLVLVNSQISIVPDASLPAAFTLLALPVGMLIAWALFDAQRGHWLGWLALAVGSICALASIGSYLLGAPRGAGLLADPNVAARLLNLLFFIILGAQLTGLRGAHQWLLSGVLVLIAMAIAATASRAGIACWWIGALGVLVVAWRAGWYRPGLLASAAGMVLMLAVVIPSPANVGRFEAGGSSVSASFEVRHGMRVAAVTAWYDYPWTGGGLQSFQVRYPSLRSPSETGSSGSFVHNDLLQALHDGGVPLLALVLMFTGALGWRWLSLAIEGTGPSAPTDSGPGDQAFESPQGPAMSLCALTGCGTVLAHALTVSFALYVLPLMLLLGLAAGIGCWVPSPSSKQIRPHSQKGVLLFVSAIWIGATFLLAVDAFSAGLLLGHRGFPGVAWLRSDTDRVDIALATIASMNPHRGLPLLGRAEVSRLRMRRSEQDDELPALLAATIALYERNIALDPWRPDGYARYSGFLLENQASLNRWQRARIPVLARTAVDLDPANHSGYQAMLAFYRFIGDERGEYALLRQDWYPWQRLFVRRYPDAWVQYVEDLANAARAAGDAPFAAQMDELVVANRAMREAARNN